MSDDEKECGERLVDCQDTTKKAAAKVVPCVKHEDVEERGCLQTCAICCCLFSSLLTICCVIISAMGRARSHAQLVPLPSSEELAELRGLYFERPSDGRLLEYYVVGPEDASDAVVMVMGSQGTGRGFCYWRHEQVDAVLRERNVKMICPTIPGYGASEGYAEYEDMTKCSARNTLKAFTGDVSALLREHGVERVYTMGVSYGTEFAFHLSSTFAESDEFEVVGAAGLAASPWARTSFIPEVHPTMPWVTKLFSMDFVAAPLYLYMFRPLMMKGDVMRNSMPPDQQKRLDEKYPGVIELMDADMARGLKHTISGLMAGTAFQTGAKGTTKMLADYQALDAKGTVDIRIYRGEQDKDVAKSSIDWMQEQMPSAQLVMYDGDHMMVPVEEALTQMLQMAPEEEVEAEEEEEEEAPEEQEEGQEEAEDEASEGEAEEDEEQEVEQEEESLQEEDEKQEL